MKCFRDVSGVSGNNKYLLTNLLCKIINVSRDMFYHADRDIKYCEKEMKSFSSIPHKYITFIV